MSTKVEGVELLVLDKQTVSKIVQRYRLDPEQFMLAENEQQLVFYLLDPAWIWFEFIQERMLVGFQIAPDSCQAFLHILGFEDSKLTKQTVARFADLLAQIMHYSNWERITGVNPSDSSSALAKILMLVGFKFEGLVRRSIKRMDGFVDAKIFGLLKSEAKQLTPISVGAEAEEVEVYGH